MSHPATALSVHNKNTHAGVVAERQSRFKPFFVLLMFASFTFVNTRLVNAQTSSNEEQDSRIADAQAACLANQLDKGLGLLARLFSETQDPLWIFNQARCYQQNHRPEEARERFREFLRKSDGKDLGREDRARKLIAEIDLELNRKQPSIGSPNIAVTEKRDDEAEQRVSGVRVASYIAVGVGVVGLGAAAIFSSLQGSKSDEAEKMAPAGVVTPGNKMLSDNFDSGKALGTYALTSLVVGSAALVTGGILYWRSMATGSEHQGSGVNVVSMAVAPTLSPGGIAGAVLSGRF